jgi:uncharacterized protein YecE (DUF72 family)
MEKKLSIGIAGWSYPDWNGIVYTQSKQDQLAYVSGFVDCIEINSSFYRVPSARTTQSWLDRTRDREGFFFTAKLHQSVTHEGRMDADVVTQFHEGLEPLLKADRLKHVLAQFRYDFADTPQTRQQLRRIVDHFGSRFNLVVEVRHQSWGRAEGLTFLGDLGVTVCNLDYPVSGNSFDVPYCTVGQQGYVRLHGRNYETWFSKAGRDQTYNYYYKQQELNQIKDRLAKLADSFWHIVVIGNNHYKGAELANAIELKSLVTGKKQPVPSGLLKEYPHLEKIALPEPPPEGCLF